MYYAVALYLLAVFITVLILVLFSKRSGKRRGYILIPADENKELTEIKKLVRETCYEELLEGRAKARRVILVANRERKELAEIAAELDIVDYIRLCELTEYLNKKEWINGSDTDK